MCLRWKYCEFYQRSFVSFSFRVRASRTWNDFFPSDSGSRNSFGSDRIRIRNTASSSNKMMVRFHDPCMLLKSWLDWMKEDLGKQENLTLYSDHRQYRTYSTYRMDMYTTVYTKPTASYTYRNFFLLFTNCHIVFSCLLRRPPTPTT
jgi:hypothetical protein